MENMNVLKAKAFDKMYVADNVLERVLKLADEKGVDTKDIIDLKAELYDNMYKVDGVPEEVFRMVYEQDIPPMRAWRLYKDIRITDAAIDTKMSTGSYHQMEHNNIQRTKTVAKMSKYFNVTPEQLLFSQKVSK